jgi:hypothetical protein
LIRSGLVAHGIGGRLDLPVPLAFFAAGAAVVLIVTFLTLATVWLRPRFQDGPRYRPTGRTVRLGALNILGFLGLALVVLAGISSLARGGDQAGTRSIGPVLVWVYFWLVVPFLGAFLGDLYTGINPWRTLSHWLAFGELERPVGNGRPGRRIGLWPAALLLVAVAWLELVNPGSADPATLAIAALVFSAFLLTMIARYGRETALTSFDPFTSYNRFISAISPFGRNASGRLMYRGWLRALVVIPEWPGLTAFVVIMIGTVSFDGLSATSWWEAATGGFGASIIGRTVLLIAMCLAIGGTYFLACFLAVRLGGGGRRASQVASRFAHTLVPIAFAYAVAHYFTLIIFEGQSLLSAASDPFGLGWDLFGTRSYKINFFLGALPIWYIQVGAIVLGHVAGVVLAHDRALVDFKGLGAMRSQYAMLLLMVLLTTLGLFILAG